ncbi:Pentatricopeptide repeat-containing protein [Forsythia ovata]|uniref:Pentatricopeptide repeat-containing protein n=1 Tax=Forsythia ovata TaxID=205694 RepID=A0ABD1X2V1_9LAMI
MILEQDPNDPAAYILLSNLYASRGQWENVAKIRKGMKERNLVKEAGCSWIEAENKVHKFYVGDTKHPQARDIYEELDRLLLEIKRWAISRTQDFVLHEVEEEQKEQYLFQHSEKLALAFSLISTSKPKPIRIFKNLRVCGDCHTAMKYISIATGREIVVRDSNRFHHIINGSCSSKCLLTVLSGWFLPDGSPNLTHPPVKAKIITEIHLEADKIMATTPQNLFKLYKINGQSSCGAVFAR